VTRSELKSWINGDVVLTAQAVHGAPEDAGVDEGGIDRVFLNGGTSLVPAVRRVFTSCFDE